MTQNNAINYNPTQYNIQTGGANNINNNVAPSSTSGVPLISQGASSQPIFGTAVVSGGGTSDTSFTAYAVICGGTTSTGALQSIASIGTSGQVLTSNGAGNLPTFQSASLASGGYTVRFSSTNSSPSDSQTYYISPTGYIWTNTTDTTLTTRLYIPIAGTITKFYGQCISAHFGSSENVTVKLRLNGSGLTTLTSTLSMANGTRTFNGTALSVAVSAGDYIETQVVTPIWVSNPDTVSICVVYQIS